MDRFTAFWLPLLLLSSGAFADADNDSAITEHRVPRVTGRIVKVYTGNRPEPYLCNNEGYKADPHSCASFYRCVKERNGKLNVFRYQCAPGTVYDPDLETCNHPRSTRRTECGGMMTTVTTDFALNDMEIKKELPRPINTNKLAFQQSTIKEKAEKSWLASGTTKMPLVTTIYSSPFTLAAYLSDTTKQNQGYNFVEPESTSWTSNKQEFDWDKMTSLPKVSNLKNDDICSDDGFTGDTDNCRKFYRCVGNQRGGFLRYEFFCSESTIWDEQIQSCNHPWAVKRSKCGRSLPLVSKISTEPSIIITVSTVPETTPISTSTFSGVAEKIKTIQQQLQISHGSKVTQTQTQISHSDQVDQNQTQIHYGDRKAQNNVSGTKQNQTQIAHGSAVSQTQTQIDYGTKGVQTQLQIDHSKDSSQSQTQIQESTTTNSPSSNQNSQCSESGFIGDSNDCKKFYRCVNNGRGSYTKYEYKCGEGTVWDQSIDACNHAWAVKECGGQSHSDSQSSSTVQSTTYREKTTTQWATQSTLQSSETDTDDNDVGYGNQDEATTTTTKKPQYQTTNIPEHQTTKESQNESNNNNVCKSSGFIGDANNCKKFYRCVDNGMGGYTRHEFTCGEGTVWDISIEACNHAWAVKSCGGNGSSNQGSHSFEPTTTATYEETTTSTARPVDKTTENTDKPIYSTSTESSTSTITNTLTNKDNKCQQSGFMGDNQNCKKFYRCVDNGDGTYARYDFTCGEGTVWDSKINACNHEWAVEKCGENGDSSTISHSTTSKQPILQDDDKDNEPTTDNIENSSTTQHTTTTTTVKNEVITSDQDCTRDGFIGDKNDCKKFYRCVENNNGGYDRYKFSCGEGTVWDDSITACNHAWAVKNCGATGSDTSQSNSESTPEGTTISTETDSQNLTQQTTDKSTSTTGNPTENEVIEGDCESEGFFGSSVDCKKFIRCVDNGQGGFTKYEFTCGEGTTWNQNIAACDHPSPGRPCGQNHQSTTKASQVNDEMITETTTLMDTSTSSPDKEESQETQKPQHTSSGKCESDGFYGDPSNCKKFYRCVDDGKGGYTKYDFTCGDGTVWNQDIVACDHESDDKSCLSSTTPTEESSSQLQSTTSKSPSDSTISSSTALNIQENDKTEASPTDECNSEGFFPHSNDCKKFVRCVDNGDGGYTRYEFSCGQGTVWVQEIQTCDHDNGQSTCSQQSETSKKPQDSGISSTTESENSENQIPNKENDEYPDQTTKQPSNTESGKCTSEGYFGNKNDCRKFYRCVDNGNGGYNKFDFDCGEGTAWDSSINTCNHISEVESCSENNKEENQTQQTMKDEDISQTTESSLSTTKPTSSSESSEEPESGSNTGSDDKCDSEGYYGDSKDCTKFYRCVDDGKGGFTKYDFTCAEGTIWDQDITNCNHPRDVNNPSCGTSGGDGTDVQSSSTGSSTSSTTGSPESTSSSSTSDNSTQSSSNCSQEESSKKPDSSKDIKCDKAGYYPNPNDCKKFYRCVDWDGDGKRFSVYHFECGEGTIWDPALDTCNHEESVYPPRDCSQTQSQSETSEGTTQKQEETTTEESTTTQESTTREQTTTEQEETTTQQSTTSEKTTTEQSTTSEQTTTEESSTSEQTTTQQSASSEKTTTQESTTSERTTTQQSISEQTTTQQSTTSEQTTTQQSTSELTTEDSTTSEQTTEESTTSQQTTQEQTTEQTTTQESTEQTNSSNTDGTTEGSTESDNSSTTEQSSTTEAQQESTESSSSNKECPETVDDQYLLVCPTSFRRHPKYCNMFYQCKEDEDTHEVNVATFKCPNETIYDESQTKCVAEKEADKKCDGEMARRQRFKRLHKDSKEPITVDKGSKSCPKEGYYAFEKNVECSNGFLKCEKSKSGNIRGYVHQCPEGFLFWAISKRCELGRNIRDCKRSSNDWTGRWNIPIDRKNIAF